jgi:esterase/lipase superfamily enzyme
MGNICHYLGHDFVCVILTWPAGGKGVFMGYNVDRESSEFAVADMKKAIRAIGGTEGVRAVHLIAHSRGTDVLTSAIQQLGIEAYSSRSSLSQQLKVKNIVLFAPDIDIDVASTKLFGVVSDPDARYGPKKNPNGVFPQGNVHVTIYSSPDDKALGVSSFLFSSNMRLGQQDLDRTNAQAFGEGAGSAGLVDFIEVNGTSDMFGHGYFLSNPAVSSDLVAMIRYGLKPGDPGRPLVEIKGPFWRLGGAAGNAQ